MPFDKDNPGPGRPKGVPNKTTTRIKTAYAKLLEDNLDNMSGWLAEIAQRNPDKAVELMLKLSEYLIPKLARTEQVIEGGLDLQNIKFKFGESNNPKEDQ